MSKYEGIKKEEIITNNEKLRKFKIIKKTCE